MTISKRDLNFLLALLGLVAFLALYFLVSQNLQEKADAINTSAEALRPQLAELEERYANLPTYEQGIADYRAAIADTLAQYPAGIEDEDFLVYLLGMEAETGLQMQSVSFEAPAVLLQFPCEVERDGQPAVADVTASRSGAVMTGALTYPQLKKAIDYLYTSRQRTGLDALSVSYNAESGGLTATFTVAKYLMAWDGKPNSPAEIPRLNLGTANLFGTD